MSDLTRDQVIDYLSALPVMEIAELVKALEDKWGVSAAAPVAIAAGPAAAGAEPAEEKTEFDVVLESFGEKKIAVIKALRAEVQGLGLKEAKAMVEGAPQAIKEAVPKEEAEKLKKALEEAGGKVTIK